MKSRLAWISPCVTNVALFADVMHTFCSLQGETKVFALPEASSCAVF